MLEDNVLGKETIESRRRTLRYLRELYVLRDDSLLFRTLGDLWNDDAAGQPLLAGLCALARDPVFRASTQPIFESEPGDEVTSADLAGAVARSFPESYSDATPTCKTARQMTGPPASRMTCQQASPMTHVLAGLLTGSRIARLTSQPLVES